MSIQITQQASPDSASPAMTGGKGRHRDTRDRILDSAMELFWEQGFHVTSIGDICRSANVNPGSMYYFFPGKEDLLVAVLERYEQGIYPGLLEPVWSRVTGPLERVFGLLDVYRVNLLETDFRYGCPIGNLALEMSNPSERVRERIAVNFDAWIAAVEECLIAASKGKSTEADLHALAVHVLTTMEGAVMQARTQRSIDPFDASVEQLRVHTEHVLKG